MVCETTTILPAVSIRYEKRHVPYDERFKSWILAQPRAEIVGRQRPKRRTVMIPPAVCAPQKLAYPHHDAIIRILESFRNNRGDQIRSPIQHELEHFEVFFV